MGALLSNEEVAALRRALDAYLPSLEYELARVKLQSERHEMVVTYDTLERLRRRLEALPVGVDHPVEGSIE